MWPDDDSVMTDRQAVKRQCLPSSVGARFPVFPILLGIVVLGLAIWWHWPPISRAGCHMGADTNKEGAPFRGANCAPKRGKPAWWEGRRSKEKPIEAA
jgi:hypothetical protein